jgi:hypothetical protein
MDNCCGQQLAIFEQLNPGCCGGLGGHPSTAMVSDSDGTQGLQQMSDHGGLSGELQALVEGKNCMGGLRLHSSSQCLTSPGESSVPAWDPPQENRTCPARGRHRDSRPAPQKESGELALTGWSRVPSAADSPVPRGWFDYSTIAKNFFVG